MHSRQNNVILKINKIDPFEYKYPLSSLKESRNKNVQNYSSVCRGYIQMNMLKECDQKTLLAWAVCCPISDHVMILVRILAFKFSNSRVCMSE